MTQSQSKIDKRNLADMIGLTAMQEGMLFHYLSSPGSKQYFEQFRFGLTGPVELHRFKQAWAVVARNNEILRAVIRWERLEEPVQIVLKQKEIPVRFEDFSSYSEEEQQGRVDALIESDRSNPVDLTRDPFRITLCRLNDNESMMVLSFHHILFDGWSTGIMLSEFLDAYNKLSDGQSTDRLKTAKTPYKDFYKWVKGRDAQEQDEFWKRCMDGFNTCTALPYDHRRLRDIQTVATHNVEFPTEIGKAVDSVTREHGLTLASVLYAAWGILLQKYNNSDDIVFGTTVAGRTPEVKAVVSVVGLFINTLPLRLKSTGHMTGLDTCRLVAEHLNQRTQFEHTGLTSIKKFSGIGKDNNLFDSIFVIDNYPLDSLLNLDGALKVASYDLFEMTSFDLTIQVIPHETLSIAFHYNPDVFDPHTVERMSRHFVNILDALTSDPHQTVNRLPMLCPGETHRILAEFNQPEISFVVDQTIHQVIEEQAARTPGNKAVQFEDQSVTYEQFNRQCNRLARLLRERGVEKGSRVALMIPRSIEMIAGVIAILKAGAACVPLDISYPDERNCFIIEDSGARFFLKTPDINLQHGGDVLDIDYVPAQIEDYDGENLDVEVNPKDLSYIIYTSGSTGKPKGALLHHSGVVNHTWTKIQVLGITQTDSVANNFSVNVIAAVWQILSPLFTGARLVVYSDDVEWDPYLQFRRVAQDRVTVIEVIPSILKTYLFLLDDGKEKINLDGLRRIALTSEETKPFLVNKFYGLYSVTRLVDCYGQTECCDDILHHTIPYDTETTVVPIGTPSINTHVLVLNHHNQLQPVGVVGEICGSGAGVAYGYWNRPELSAEKFVENPLDPGKPMYRTGDLGRWRPDGCVEFLGRIDHQVKIRGNRVELREIENRLIGFPDIIEAAVIAKEDKQSELNLYAFFDAERQLTAAEIREYLLKQLPDYMVPVQFVQMDELPLTPNGKIDRKALAKIKGSIATGTEYQPPRSDIEAQIETIWRQLLDKEPIGIEDNFFDLGGHSLLLIKLKSKLEKAFDREIDIIELFNYPTISLQARFITGSFDAAQVFEDKESKTPAAQDEQAAGLGMIEDVAVIGISVKVPGANGIDAFWDLLVNGREAITFFTKEEMEESGIDQFVRGNSKLVPARGIIGNIEMFDADFFGFNPREAEMTDPQQRLFLEYAWMALEDAGYSGDTPGRTVGVYGGVGMNTYILNNVMSNPEVVNTLGEFQTMIGNDKDFLTTRTAYKLGLSGPALTVQTACSTSLVAIHLARRALLNRECHMALAGGVFLSIPEKNGYFYNEGGYLSPDGHCRAFSKDAQGTVFGNGVGIVVLKPLQQAKKDNDHIYAVLKGTAINNDGAYKVGYTSPSEIGQAAVITSALKEARVHPRTVGYVETHGTGTVLGDPVEISALTRAHRSFPADESPDGNNKDQNQYCAVASVKANIGHLDTAAGVVGLIKAVLALKNKKIPPSINVGSPNPIIDFPNTPFYVATQAEEWQEPAPGVPRRAGVSSFGIGGTNAHAVLEETTDSTDFTDGEETGDSQLVVLSARSEAALRESAERMARYFKKNSRMPLQHPAFTLASGRKAFEHRLAVVCDHTADAANVLEEFNPKRILMQQRTEGEKSVVFMFSGVGEHYVNMTSQLYSSEDVFKEEIDRCCDILKPILDEDLRDVLYPASTNNEKEPQSKTIDLRQLMGRGEKQLSPEAQRLNRTVYLQTAVFVVEYALARLLMSWGITPYAMIGYSTGEYVAACLSGVFSLEDALNIVAQRAKLIDNVQQGAMTAVSLAEDQLRPLLADGVAVAAVNTPDLCIVSGTPEGIDALESTLKENGHIFRRLNTFQAFHSPMMKAVRPQLSQLFKNITVNAPTIPYMSNVTGDWVTREEVVDPEYWITHTESAIRFSEGIHRLLDTSCDFFLEVGPGNSLCGFAAPHLKGSNKENKKANDKDNDNENNTGKKTRPRLLMATLPKESENIPDRSFLLRALGKLWIAGQTINWNVFYKKISSRRVPLPTYPFQRKRFWLEAAPMAARDTGAAGSPGKAAAHPGAGAIRKKEDIGDWFYAPTWKQSPPLFDALPGNQTGEPSTWLLLTGNNRLSRQLAERLKTLGHDVIDVRMGLHYEEAGNNEYKIHPANYDHYTQLIEDLQAKEKTVDRIVHLWTWWDGDRGQHLWPGIEPLDPGVHGLFYLAKALGHSFMFNAMDLWVVSRGVFNIESIDDSIPEHTALNGPVKVVSQEYPNITGRLIDLAPAPRVDGKAAAQAMARVLLNEFIQAPRDRTIAYRGSRRWVRTYDAVPPPEPGDVPPVLRQNGVYLITGGLGNIGLTLGQYLARAVKAKIILTTRSPFSVQNAEPGDARADAIRQMENDGGEVMVVQADVADHPAMEKALKTAEERFGNLNGVIHAAGVMDPKAFKLVSDLDADDCKHHFLPKINGLQVLEQILAGKPLDFCLLTSSLSPVLGGLSLYAYSAANGYMDGVAQSRSYDSLPWFSINWADWQRDEPVGGGIGTVIGATVSALNITAREGEETFKRALMLSASMPRVVISSGDLHSRLLQWVLPDDNRAAGNDGDKDTGAPQIHQRPQLQTIYEAPGTEAEKIVAEIWQELLGLDMVGIHDNFFELGGHSLIATKLISRLREIFRIDMPLPTLFDRPTIREIIQYIIETWGDPETVQTIAETYREVQQMT